MQEAETLHRTTPTGIAVKVATIETPTHLIGWLPILWTSVLFPGQRPSPEPLRVWPIAALFVLSGALLYPCVSFNLFEPDEGRYAQIPREMLTAGVWVVPTLQEEAYLDKPPLFYWLVMISYSIFGFSDGAARLVPAVSMHAAVLVTYLLGRRAVGEREAFWGALLLMVSPIFLGVGRLLVLDGLLTLWVTMALLAAYIAQADERLRAGWWLLATVALGLGVLTKGPVALVLLLVPLCTHRWLTTSAPITWRAWATFAAIVAAINLPWYIAVCWQRPEFVRYFLWQHNVERFVEPFDHIRPVWFYVPIVLFGLLPTLVLAWPLLKFMTSTQTNETKARCGSLGFLLLAGVWCVFFFSLAGSKLPTYILPAFPPLCLALGCFVARTHWHRSRWFIGVVTVCGLVLACSHYVAIPVWAREKSPMQDFAGVQATCGDPSVPVVCFPRHVDSVAFYLGRSDFRTFRSKEIDGLIRTLEGQPRTVVLFGHRNSPGSLKRHLPPHLRMVDRRPMGLCEMAIIERAN